MKDSYLTIARESQSEIKEKGSRFIGESFLVQTPEQSLERLQIIRKREHSASHHCFAYQLGTGDSSLFKYSDDGEPSGTAGRPIYDAIMGNSLTDCLVVVTRYFGGTKLGTGGLARAYAQATNSVLALSGCKEIFLLRRFKVILDFQYYDSLLILLRKHQVNIVTSDFAEHVTIVIDIRIGQVDTVMTSCADMSSGRILIEEIKT